jgi:hypothetical protein
LILKINIKYKINYYNKTMTSVNYEENILPPINYEDSNKKIPQLIHPDLLEEHNILTPPPPAPRPINEIIVPGKFDYIKEEWEKTMLINAWEAITLTETWDFVKKPCESFMYSNDPRIQIITNKMEELGYNGHSGCSFGSTMRAMQYIACYGEEKFKESREKGYYIE